MKHPKFIIENDNLILGKVQFHKHLATDSKGVKGGGWYEFDYEKKCLLFTVRVLISGQLHLRI